MTQYDHDVPLIEIRNATVYRGDTCVFRNLDLSIAQHEAVAVLGPNGSGKTTLLKMISREIYPVPGKASVVRILGRDRWNVWELRSRIGVVSHDLQTAYRSESTGLDVVISGFFSSIGMHGMLRRRISASQREQAVSILQELGAADLADRPFRKMSTGQQRRCLLGRALVHGPDTLVLDEPTAGLDLAAAFDYLNRIRALSRAGKTIILVSHSLSEIPPEIGRVVLLRGGKIVADGRKDDVLNAGNLRAAFGVDLQLARIDGYYFAYPPGTGDPG